MGNQKLLEDYSKNGYVTIKNFFKEDEYDLIFDYVEKWINKNISNALGKKDDCIILPLKDFHNYHKFIIDKNIDHSKIASAKFRYIEPPDYIISIIQKKELFEYLKIITSANEYTRWQDPGFGWLGYRLIRGASEDGYPPSCKNWGAAFNVYSIWLPIAGCTELSNIRFIPSSHKKRYKSYLPSNSKFTKGEYRLDEDIPNEDYVRPIANPRDIIIYDPATIHSEDSNDNLNTRLNLEYRFRPNYES